MNYIQLWCQSPYETLWENRSQLVWALKLNDVMCGAMRKSSWKLLRSLYSLFRQIEMEYGRHCVRTAKAGNRLTFGDITIVKKVSHLKMHDYKNPHGCTSESNKPYCLLIWLTLIPNKPCVLNKATGCYIRHARVVVFSRYLTLVFKKLFGV